MRIETLTIVGVRLIGSSVGLAAKRRGVARRVIGVGRRQQSLDEAATRGVIDERYLDLASAARRADVVLVCTPVDQIAEQVVAAAAVCEPGTLLIDAGSTKAAIVDAVEDSLPRGLSLDRKSVV